MRFVSVAVSILLLSGQLLAQWQTDGNPVCTYSGYQSSPKIISDGQGGAIIVWQDQRYDFADIFAQRIDRSGLTRWATNGVPVIVANESQGGLQVVGDDSGGAYIVWYDYRSGTYSDIYAQRLDSLGNRLWATGGVTVCDTQGNQGQPTLAKLPQGGVIIAWSDYRNNSHNDVYAQRLDPQGNALWVKNGVPVCQASGQQQYPKAVSDGSGGAIIAWVDPRSGNSDIYAQRLDSSGTALWAADGVGICLSTGEQINMILTADNAGNYFAAWEDYRSGSSDIYAQKFDGGGNVLWAANGVAVCAAGIDQTQPTLCPDGQGGAYFAWGDYRTGSYYDVYAQRITSTGSAAGAANGVVIANYSGHQLAPALASTPDGQAICVWQDYRNGSNYDLYAQRLDAYCQKLWADSGMAVSKASQGQEKPAIIPDGFGGALIAWQDMRLGNNDIYAQMINPEGNVGVAQLPSEPLWSPANLSCSPNPTKDALRISYSVVEDDVVQLKVYSITGKLLKTINNGYRRAGNYKASWDCRDQNGRKLPAGVYFLRMEKGRSAEALRLVVIR